MSSSHLHAGILTPEMIASEIKSLGEMMKFWKVKPSGIEGALEKALLTVILQEHSKNRKTKQNSRNNKTRLN